MIRINRGWGRRIGLVAAGLALLASSACGFNAQTLQQYTPAEGVNVDVGLGSDQLPVSSTVIVRGLMVISRSPGSGFLSASVQTGGTDELTGVSGTVIKTDGSLGDPISATLSAPVSFSDNQLLLLTDGTAITISSADLMAGGNVRLTLSFAKAGSTTINTPVVDGDLPNYQTVSPSPAPSSSSSS